MGLEIRGGRVLREGRWDHDPIAIDFAGGRTLIAGTRPNGATTRSLDATGLLVLPGLIDIHGDAFERQIEPRPLIRVDLDLALLETDRQLAANGITTAYHAVTWSWEPGLRGSETVRAILGHMAKLNAACAVDTRVHLRHETYNLAAEAEIIALMQAGRIGALAFNDHMSGTIKNRHRPEKMAKMVERSGLTPADFDALVDRVYARREEVPSHIARLASAAKAANIPVLSHDDPSPDARSWYRELGVVIAEFPMTEATAATAIAAGEPTVFGAPNVIRGGSHTGCPTAAEMVRARLCSILASDYYYPALLQAPFRLAADGIATLEETWPLVSANPARALGLLDRGTLAAGRRADIILVDAAGSTPPRVIATIVDGHIRYLTEAARLR